MQGRCTYFLCNVHGKKIKLFRLSGDIDIFTHFIDFETQEFQYYRVVLGNWDRLGNFGVGVGASV